jgi:hypothetical protein
VRFLNDPFRGLRNCHHGSVQRMYEIVFPFNFHPPPNVPLCLDQLEESPPYPHLQTDLVKPHILTCRQRFGEVSQAQRFS